MLRRVLMCFAVVTATEADPLRAQEAAVLGPWVRVADSFVQHLKSGAFDDAAAMIAPGPAKDALPAAKLEEIWKQLTGAVGELVSLTPARVTDQDTLRVVELNAGFERQQLLIRLVFTPREQVAGLWFLPPAPPAYTPPPYADPTVFEEVDVVVGEEPWRLPGTLTLPRLSGAVPVVVLVGGSGPIDRDGTLGPNRAYCDLAWGLASRGVAVLRYDKRTRAHGAKIDPASVTVDEEVIDDALAALALVRSHDRIDTTRVVLAGHSLGGMLAPQIAERGGSLAGIIMLAAPARPLTDVMADQLEYIMTLTPVGAGDQQHPLRAIRDTVELLRRQELPADRVVLGAPASYVYDLSQRDLVGAAKRLKLPILILQGGRDYQSTLEDFELWRRTLAGRPTVTLRAFPDLNHMFFPGRGMAVPEEYLQPAVLSESVVSAIEEWMGSLRPSR